MRGGCCDVYASLPAGHGTGFKTSKILRMHLLMYHGDRENVQGEWWGKRRTQTVRPSGGVPRTFP